MMCGGSLEIEVERVADVERENFVSLLDDFVGHAGQVANGVADIVETLGSGDLVGLGDGHQESLRSLRIVQESASGKWNGSVRRKKETGPGYPIYLSLKLRITSSSV